MSPHGVATPVETVVSHRTQPLKRLTEHRFAIRIQRILQHEGVWSGAAQALASGVSFCVSLMAARILGIEQFGRFVLLLTGVFIVGALQHQVVSGPMMTVAGLRQRTHAYYSAAARWLILASLLSGLAVALYVVVLFGWKSGKAHLDLAAAGFLVGFGIVLHDGLKRVLFATRRPRAAFLFESLRYLTFALAVLACFLTIGIGTISLLICLGLAPALVSLPLLAKILLHRSRRRLDLTVFARHWKVGGWMALMVLVSTAHEHVVTIAAGSMLGESAAAGLRSAQILFGPVLILMMSLENVVPRRAAEEYRVGGVTALSRYLNRVLCRCFIPFAAFCGTIALFEDELLTLLLGPAFTAFDQLVTVFAVVPLLVLAREMGMIYLRTIGETREVFISFSFSCAAVLFTLVPLIQSHGLTGAAVAFVLGHVVSTVFVLAYARKRHTKLVTHSVSE